eukprot:GHVO01033191.1.p1 GENE.GHVO01033191.1~~GHVO01033191.1.p1  ORF type:complete len:439 (+),score=65.49 GHVO01033191.1:158-1474(+)
MHISPDRKCVSDIILPPLGPDLGAFSKLVGDRYRESSNDVCQFILNTEDLRTQLHSLRRFMFVTSSDFLCNFFDRSMPDLDRKSTSLSKLQMSFDGCIKSSSLANDPYASSFSIGYSSMVMQDIVRLFDPSWHPNGPPSLNENELKSITGWKPAAPHSMKQSLSSTYSRIHQTDTAHEEVLKLITLKFKTTWPSTLVIEGYALAKYQAIFRCLAQFKATQARLCSVWQDQMLTRQFRRLSRTASQHLSVAFFTRQRMLHFCWNILYYLTTEVLEPRSQKFEADLSRATSVEDVISMHTEFLDACLNECMLNEAELFRTLSKVLGICQLFVRHTLKFNLYGGIQGTHIKSTGRTRRQSINEAAEYFERLVVDAKFWDMVSQFERVFDKNMKTFLKELSSRSATRKHMSNLASRLDANGYYSRYFSLSAHGIMEPSITVP